MYQRKSGIPGGFKTETVRYVRERQPRKIIEKAVRGMLPHTTLGEKQFTKLKVYKGSTHPHQMQKPVKLEIKRR